MPFLSFMNGYKTYAGAGLGILAILANQHGMSIPGIELDPQNWLSDIFKMLMLMTARHAIAKIR